MAKAVMFTNWSNEDFTHTWDGVEYVFPKQRSTYLQGYLAVHFAKHLANREMNRMGETWMEADQRFENLMKKCLVEETEIEAKSDVELESKLLNVEKEKPKSKKVVKEEESFEGLNETA